MNLNTIISSSFIKTLVFANVFVALCAFAQVLVTYHLFPVPFNEANNFYLLFVLLSTYLQYNMQRGYIINTNNLNSERSQWLIKYKRKLFITIGGSLIILLFLCNNLSWISISIMVGVEVISTLYYLPNFNLRKFGYIKPFLISAVWVVSCSVVPLIENQLLSAHSLFYIISQFFFLIALCLMFDIKDAEEDYLTGINTYTNCFGIKFTKIACMVCIILSTIFFYLFSGLAFAFAGSMILCVITFVSVLFANDKKHPFYFYVLIDGLMILQTILCFLL